MIAVDVDALEAARAAATAGPWLTDVRDGHAIVRNLGKDGGWGRSDLASLPGQNGPADAALIVAAVNAVPQLVAALRERDALRAAVEALAGQLDAEAFGDGRGTIDAAPALLADRLRALLADVDGGQR